MKIRKRIFSTLCIALCAALLFCSCGKSSDNTEIQCNWQLADIGRVSVHRLYQEQYLQGDYLNIGAYAKGKSEMSRPMFIRLNWSAKVSGYAKISRYDVELRDANSEYNAMYFSTQETYLDVCNLYIGTQYVWSVTAVFSNGKESKSPLAVFETEDTAPRNLYISGITNVRDLGGWKTPEGRVRQGMIYRCGRLNMSGTTDVTIEITQEGIYTMRNVLGIKTEIDLRMPNAYNTETGGITSSPLGNDVNYINCPMDWVESNSLTENLGEVKHFFSIISDIENYPIIFHCNIGTDRTGLLAFLINGLLGVSEEDLYRDYLFSNFGNIGSARDLNKIQSSYIATVKEYKGATLSEQIENCLIELVEVPKAQIDAVKTILT